MAPTNQTKLSVLVCYAEPLMARGLVSVLTQEPDLAVRAIEPEAGERVDVVVTDYQQGIFYAEQMRNKTLRGPLARARILVLSPSQRELEVRRALEVGVQGFLVLGCALDELATAVRALGAGNRYYDPHVVERMAESLMHEALTVRETDVLTLLAQGQCNKSIARDLSIAVGTVKAHVKSILAKLDASGRTHAASIAAQRGLVANPVETLFESGALRLHHLGTRSPRRTLSESTV